MRLIGALTALVLLGVVGSAGAVTYQGTISTPVVSPDGRAISAQVTMSSSCLVGEYCGFFPEVTTVQDPQPCSPTITGSSWVGPLVLGNYGDVGETLPPATATWSEYPSLYAGAKHACLYAKSAGILVAQVGYTVPAPAPAPVYTPPVVPTPAPVVAPAPAPATQTVIVPIPDLPFLSRLDGTVRMRGWVKRRYGRRWTLGRGRVVRCPVRASDAQLGCLAAWSYKHHVYSKTLVITEGVYGGFTYSKDFASAPSQVQAVTVPSTSAPADFCATHDCIPNYDNGTGSTVRCSDGTYSQSGGKQGACSYHGGVSHAMVVRRPSAASAADRAAAERQAALVRSTLLFAAQVL
jgi:hypothetical protein